MGEGEGLGSTNRKVRVSMEEKKEKKETEEKENKKRERLARLGASIIERHAFESLVRRGRGADDCPLV